MDSASSYIHHFSLKILVLPVTPIRTLEFERHFQLLEDHSRIALADVPPPTAGSSSGAASRNGPRSNGAVPGASLGAGSSSAAGLPASDRPASVTGPVASSSKSSANTLLASTPASRGFLNLRFVRHWDSKEHAEHQAWLEEFQFHRKVVAVIGILDCAEWDGQEPGATLGMDEQQQHVVPNHSKPEGLQEARRERTPPPPRPPRSDSDALAGLEKAPAVQGRTLKDGAKLFHEMVYSRAPRDIFAKRCYAFNPADHQNDDADGLVLIPTVGDLGFYIHTLLAELSSSILAGLSRAMISLDSRSFVAMPRERPLFANGGDYLPRSRPASLDGKSEHPHRLSAPQPQAATRAASPQTVPGSALAPIPGAHTRAPSPMAFSASARSVSSTGSPADAIDSKTRKRLAGRLQKLRGDLYCLAGRTVEGMACYNEAIATAKAQSDHVWQAAAMEASLMAQVYHSWSQGQPQARNSMATSRPSLTDLTAKPANDPTLFYNPGLGRDLPPQFSTLLSLYTRHAPQRNSVGSDPGADLTTSPLSPINTALPDSEDQIHPQLFVETCMHFIRLQLAILFSGGVWNLTVIALIIGKGQGTEPSWPRPGPDELYTFSLSSPIPRRAVVATLDTAYSYATDPRVSQQARLAFLSSLADLYALLHYPRKEASLLREIAAATSSLAARPAIGCRQPNGGTYEATRPEEERLRHLRLPGTSETASNQSIIHLAEKAIKAYGVKVVTPAQTEPSVIAEGDIARSEASMLLLPASHHGFGWPDLQLAIVQDAIRMSDILPDYNSAIRFSITAVRELVDVMSPSDQLRLSDNIAQLFAASAQHGNTFDISYWGPQSLIMSIEVPQLPPHLAAVEHPYIDASAVDAPATSNLVVTQRDRVFHSVTQAPLLRQSRRTQPILVAGEPIELFVTLQNPFPFELLIESLRVSTSGVTCETDQLQTSIPPSSFHTIRVACRPSASGTLLIRGCVVRIPGCSARDFPVLVKDVDASKKRQRPSPGVQAQRIKTSGLKAWRKESMIWLKEKGESIQEAPSTECKVIPQQPLLQVKGDNLSQGSLILYEGERGIIRVVTETAAGSPPIDLVKVTLQDSYTASTRAYLSENDVKEMEVYELESDIITKPPLEWVNRRQSDKVLLKAGDEETFEVACIARSGFTNGSVQVDYASIGLSEGSATPTVFYTRQITVPFTMNVQPSPRCTALHILPVPPIPPSATGRHAVASSTTSLGQLSEEEPSLTDSLGRVDGDECCLLVLEVTNHSLTQVFDIILQQAATDEQATSSHLPGTSLTRRIEAGATVNIASPVSRFSLSSEDAAKPIPSLSDKQFVFGRDTTTAMERELFWYRERLIRCLSLNWREAGASRSGYIDMSRLPLTEAMMGALKLSELNITTTLSVNGTGLEQDDQGRWPVQCGDFVEVAMRLRNRGSRHLRLTAAIELQRTSFHQAVWDWRAPPLPDRTSHNHLWHSYEAEYLARHILFDGARKLVLPSLAPGAEAAADFAVCMVSTGFFGLDCRLSDDASGFYDKQAIHVIVS